jgi:hypothetical protein
MNRARRAMDEGKPTVVDAGALSLLPHAGLIVATPHAGEMAKVFGVTRESVEGAPAEYALLAASQWNATVLLKGSTTFIANQFGDEFSVSLATPWLAIAGAGDVLGGVLGSMIATRATDIAADQRVLARIAASAVVIHSLAAQAASAGGPFLLEQLVSQIPTVIRGGLGLAALGIPEEETTIWWGMIAPRGVPADRVATLQAAFRQAAASDRFRQLLEAQGVTPGWVEGAAMGTVMRREYDELGRVATAIGLQRPR